MPMPMAVCDPSSSRSPSKEEDPGAMASAAWSDSSSRGKRKYDDAMQLMQVEFGVDVEREEKASELQPCKKRRTLQQPQSLHQPPVTMPVPDTFQDSSSLFPNSNHCHANDLFGDIDDSLFAEIDVDVVENHNLNHASALQNQYNQHRNQHHTQYTTTSSNMGAISSFNVSSISAVSSAMMTNSSSGNGNGNGSGSGSTTSVDWPRIQECVDALDEEREWLISMLDGRKDWTGFQRWTRKLHEKYVPKITRLARYQQQMAAIPKLTRLNAALNDERDILLSLIERFNPNAKRGQNIWNSDFAEHHNKLDELDGMSEERKTIIYDMAAKRASIPSMASAMKPAVSEHTSRMSDTSHITHLPAESGLFPNCSEAANLHASKIDDSFLSNNNNNNNNTSCVTDLTNFTFMSDNGLGAPPVSAAVSNNNNNHAMMMDISSNAGSGGGGMGAPASDPFFSPSKNQNGCNAFIEAFENSSQKQELTRDGFAEFRHEHRFDMELERALAHRFGYNAFRTYQREICTALLLGRDCLVIMPTGYGKSITYQIPVLVRKQLHPGHAHTIIVVSPLVSLIQDQVYQLQLNNIRAVAFGSLDCNEFGQYDEAKRNEQRQHYELARNGHYELIYITPEKLDHSPAMGALIKHLSDNESLLAFAIDEAHCISQWGHDFRKSYLKLDKLKRKLAHIPIIALTATATSTVIKDVVTGLNMTECALFRQNMNRCNLFWEVRQKQGKYKDAIATLIRNTYSDCCGIVYCVTRKECQEYADFLRERGIACVIYHAGLCVTERAENQTRWSTDEVRVVIATCAFGMGINKYDVRFVIHTSMPKSVEDYYQQAGRAGRDGALSRCILYYSFADRYRIEFMLQMSATNNLELGETERKALIERDRKKMWDMLYYCQNSVDCRRSILLHFFDDAFERAQCRMDVDTLAWCDHRKLSATAAERRNKENWRGCDNCNAHAFGEYAQEDVTRAALDVCQIVQGLHALHSHKKSYETVVKVFRGSKSKEIEHIVAGNLDGFGKGAEWSDTDTRRLMAKLITMRILKEHVTSTRYGGSLSEMQLGSACGEFRGNEREQRLYLEMQSKQKLKRKNATTKRNKTRAQQIAKTSATVHAKSTRNASGTRQKRSGTHQNYTEQDENGDAEEEEETPQQQQQQTNATTTTTKNYSVSLTQNLQQSMRRNLSVNGYELESLHDQHAALLQTQLREVRGMLRNKHHLRSFHFVFSDPVMAQLARFAPVTLEDLSHFESFTDDKLKKFGDAIVGTVRDYIDSNELTTPFDAVPDALRISKQQFVEQRFSASSRKKKRTASRSKSKSKQLQDQDVAEMSQSLSDASSLDLTQSAFAKPSTDALNDYRFADAYEDGEDHELKMRPKTREKKKFQQTDQLLDCIGAGAYSFGKKKKSTTSNRRSKH